MENIMDQEPEQSMTGHENLLGLEGKWHERLGRLQEALECFYQAAVSASGRRESGTARGETAALSWLNYGRLNAKMNKPQDAVAAFRRVLSCQSSYSRQALSEWAALLLDKGESCEAVCLKLSAEASVYQVPVWELGAAFYDVGAYQEAESCFNITESYPLPFKVLHAVCLIRLSRLQEASDLLSRQISSEALFHGQQKLQRFAEDALYLCRWKLQGERPARSFSPESLVHCSETAVQLGLLAEAEALLNDEGISGQRALIVMLYAEGYVQNAMQHLRALSEQDSEDILSLDAELMFIQAEQLYDQGNYDEAAALFNTIRNSRDSSSRSSFGEAACYLQSSLRSLAKHLQHFNTPSSIREEALKYIEKVNSALHIVENTGWHTSWTPAQRRRQYSSDTSLLN